MNIFFKLLKLPRKLYKSLFLLECWQVGIIKSDAEFILNYKTLTTDYFNNKNISWFRPPLPHFGAADPFLISIENKLTCFFEKIDYTKPVKGSLSSLEIEINPYNLAQENSGNAAISIKNYKHAISLKHHLSYPYCWQHNNNIYLMPECNQSGSLPLFIYNEGQFNNLGAYLPLPAIDATRLLHNGKEWLFYSLAKKDDKLHQLSSLYISYRNYNEHSDNQNDDWIHHKKNPVKLNASSSRSAGNIFMLNGQLYRPAQNCCNIYGGEIVINHITKLNEDEFAEEEICRIQPGKKFIGTHHFNVYNGFIALDVLAEKFIFYKIFIGFTRNIRRFFWKKSLKKQS